MQATLHQRSHSVATSTAVRDDDLLLHSTVPAPFPLEALKLAQQHIQTPTHNTLAPAGTGAIVDTVPQSSGENQISAPLAPTLVREPSSSDQSRLSLESDSAVSAVISISERDVLSSLQYVQQSCLTTLDDLFSQYTAIIEGHTRDMGEDTDSPSGIKTSSPSGWNTAMPSRRHSLPARTALPAISLHAPSSTESNTPTTLDSLLTTLRKRSGRVEEQPLIQLDDEPQESATHELARRVASLSESVLSDQRDIHLAQSLASLLLKVEQLQDISRTRNAATASDAAAQDPFKDPSPVESAPITGFNVFDTLSRRVESLRLKRKDSPPDLQTSTLGESEDESVAKQKKALWTDIDAGLESVLKMCRERTNQGQTNHINRNINYPLLASRPPSVLEEHEPDHLPPEYDPADYDLDNKELHDVSTLPPEYDTFRDPYDIHHVKPQVKTASTNTASTEPPLDATSEKMRLDLESVASAIDRLYQVAPQLSNQRVELKKSKLHEMEVARRLGPVASSSHAGLEEVEAIASRVGRGKMTDQVASRPKSKKRISSADLKGKGKAKESEEDLAKRQELDRMVALIGKTSGENRRIDDQRVELGDIQSRIRAKEEKMLDQLLKHSGAGRLSSQDATLSPSSLLHSRQTQSPPSQRQHQPQESDKTLLSLPEFIREAIPPASSQRSLNPEAMLTLPEFFKEQWKMSFNAPSGTISPPSMAHSRSAPMSTSTSHTGTTHNERRSSGLRTVSITTSSQGLKSKPSFGSLRGLNMSSHHHHSPNPSTSSTAQFLQTTVSKIRGSSSSSRNRSNSAPPLNLSWLKSGRVSQEGAEERSMAALLGGEEDVDDRDANGLDGRLRVAYLAEHQENLGTVQVFLRVVQNPAPGENIEAEVLMGVDTTMAGSSRLQIRAGDKVDAILPLPVLVVPGPAEVKVAGEHLEVKLVTPPLSPPNRSRSPSTRQQHQYQSQLSPRHSTSSSAGDSHAHTLWDAEQLSAFEPTSFMCSTCSRELVSLTHRDEDMAYVDLPSEHWVELLDAWMCHPDQKLHDAVGQVADGGFWPAPGKALVGRSEVVFDQSVVVPGAIRLAGGDQLTSDGQIVACACGASVGCSQIRHGSDSITYRLAKYAITPFNPLSESVHVPLSNFIVADMMALQLAHATHRFVILDREEEKPRIIVWLFNPSVRLSYASTTPYTLLSRDSTVHAAKVLFKVINSSSPIWSGRKTVTDLYPAFAASESLFYPEDVCGKLSTLLKESSETYPVGRRAMSNLDVGWLQRS